MDKTIGANTLWDASPPTLEIMAAKCISYPSTFATGSHFPLGTAGNLQYFSRHFAKYKGRRNDEYGRREWPRMGGATTGEADGIGEKNERDRHPPS